MTGPRILGQVAGTGQALDAYASPAAGNGTAVSCIAVVNPTTGSLNAQISVVPSGATAAALHVIVPTTKIAAGDTLFVQAGISLGPGQRVNFTADTGVNVHVYGTEL